jgi:SUN domain-containing protein 1/2
LFLSPQKARKRTPRCCTNLGTLRDRGLPTAMAAVPLSVSNAITGASGSAAEMAMEVTAANTRKRTVPSRSGSEATDSRVIAPVTTTQTRRVRGEPVVPSSPGDATSDFAFSKDLSVVDGQMQVESAQTDSAKQKKVARAVVGVSAPARTSLVKHKTVKHAAGHKVASGSSKETRRSIWDVMGHLFSRLFLVFIVGAGLGTTAWSLRATSPKSIHRSSALEIEQLQEFVTKSVRGMQEQLELIDRRIGTAIGDLRNEVKEEIESEVTKLRTKVLSVTEHIDHLFVDGGPLNRNEALELMQSMVEASLAQHGVKKIGLEDVQAEARQIVRTEIEKHSADGMGRPDYALASGGGKVTDHSEGYFLGRGSIWSSPVRSLFPGAPKKHWLANKILEPSFGEPGQCLPLSGSNVYVEISLRTAIIPDAVTLEHVSKVNPF